MLLNILLLAVGFVLLLGGGEGLVRGASALALRLRIAPAVIGLTVVAFGTSAPELAVNLAAAFGNNADIAFGNIIGSNICNVALILGLCALLKPLTLQTSMVAREIPMMILASLVVLVMELDDALDHNATADIFSRGDGLLLLLLFGMFLYYTLADVVRARAAHDPLLEEAAADPHAATKLGLGAAVAFTLAGLAAVVGGGHLTVQAASALARTAGVPEVVIGLTLVAVGTSLPELVTSLVATYRGQTEIAVGNVVGSNIFNVLFILGLSATITPLPIPAGGLIDMLAMNAFALLLLPLAITDQRRLLRWEGVLLLGLYVAYLVLRVAG